MTKSPNDVLRILATDKVLNRLETYNQYYLENFEPFFNGIYLNLKLLRHAIESYFLDIYRMKNFHGIEYADCHKRDAFSMIWIVKAHPIQLATDVCMTESMLVINEVFAVHIGLAHLDIDIKDISGKYIRNLIYILHFRSQAPEILASTMYLLECGVKKKLP